MTGLPFLYPHLAEGRPRGGSSPGDHLAALAEAALVEAEVVDARSIVDNNAVLDLAAAAIRRLRQGTGRLLVLGNGGSLCDAARLARLIGDAVPAVVLDDPAALTALANDVGAERVFSRQVEAVCGPGDVLAVFTTSGESRSVLAALAVARARRATTVAFTGCGGGTLGATAAADICLVVDDTSVHRVQEAHAALVDELLARAAPSARPAPADAERAP